MSYLRLLLLVVVLSCPSLLIGQNRLSLTFIGDIMGHGAQIKDAQYREVLDSTNNPYSHCFKYVNRSLSDADFTVGNLEVTLGVKPYSGYPTFSSPVALLDACVAAGVDIFALANNHVLDRGSRGVKSTIAALEKRRLPYMGAYKDSVAREAKNGLIIEKNNIRVGLLNYTYGTNGIKVKAPTQVNYIDTTLIKEDIACLRVKNPDQIIVMLHWGCEYHLSPSIAQRRLKEFLYRNGISIIIGSHPHVVQPIEWDKQNKRLCVYSLGNFVSNQREAPKDIGLIAHVELKKDENGCVLDSVSYQTTYVHRYVQGDGYGFEVLPFSYIGQDSILHLDSMRSSKAKMDEAKIRRLLAKSKAYYHQYNDQFKTSNMDSIVPKQSVLKVLK